MRSLTAFLQIPKTFALAVTGLSLTVLRQAPDHEQAEAANRGIQLLIGLAIHLFSMGASLMLLGVTPLVALGFASLTALLLFTSDRSLITGLREQRGHRALYQKGIDFSSVLGPFARFAASIVMGLLMGVGLSLGLFDRDTSAHVTTQQAVIDRPIIVQLNQEYDEGLEQKANGILAAKQSLDSALAESAARQALLTGGMDADKLQRDALVARRSALWSEIASARAEISKLQDEAQCELTGIADNPTCAGTSGRVGEGVRYQFAKDKADRLSEQLAVMTQDLQALDQHLAGLDTGSVDVVLVDVERVQTLQAAYDAQTAEYREMVAARPEAIAAALEASPERRTIDPTSVYVRIDALGHLMASSSSFFWTAIAVKAAAVILELLPLLCELGRRPAVYDINIAASVHAAFRKHRKVILEDEAEDLPLFAELDRQRREIERDNYAADIVRRSRASKPQQQ